MSAGPRTHVLAAVAELSCPPRILEVKIDDLGHRHLGCRIAVSVSPSLRRNRLRAATSPAAMRSNFLRCSVYRCSLLVHQRFGGSCLGCAVTAAFSWRTESCQTCQPPHWRSTHRNRLHCAHGGKRRQRQQLHGPVKPRGLRLSKVIHQSPRSRGVKPRLPRERLPRRPCDHARRSPRCRRHLSRSHRRVPSAV